MLCSFLSFMREGTEGNAIGEFTLFKSILCTRGRGPIVGIPIGVSSVGYELYLCDGTTELVPFNSGLYSRLEEFDSIPDSVYSDILADLKLLHSAHIHPSVRPSYRRSAFERLQRFL